MANYCGSFNRRQVRSRRAAVLGDFDGFFDEWKEKLLPFLKAEPCWPPVCEGHGTEVRFFMDWHGGFWLVHLPSRYDDEEERSKRKIPRPKRIPDAGPLTATQLEDIAAMRGWSEAQIAECLSTRPELYQALVAQGVPPDGPRETPPDAPKRPRARKKSTSK